MTTLLWLAVIVPAGGALVVRACGTRAAGTAVAAAAAIGASVPPLLLLLGAAGGDRASSGAEWLPGPGLRVGLRLDALSAAMTATVAGVGLVVLVYSLGYFREDPRRASALAGLLGFLAAMQGLVLADGYLALLFFWEIVGAASARLIAYTRDDPRAPGGAVRAFVTTRSADLGLYVALLALYSTAGSVAFGQSRPAGALGALVGIGLVVAAAGKSAQVPLQTWLAGAMAGPTPVSALLHSATMVAAGVYLLVRSEPLLTGWPLDVAGWVGAVTALTAAIIALAQNDLKRILAGSTASQLGLMFVGAAAGGPAVAIFYLVAHAIGKAGLFLAAGVFQHERGSVELDELRGAGRDDRAAFAGFAVCALSIAAVPPLAVFWAKDHVAAAAEGNPAWFALVIASAAGSAAYLLRPALVLWDNAGAGRSSRAPGRPAMLAGVVTLASGSLLAGILGTPLVKLLDAKPLPTSGLSLTLSLTALVAGLAAVAFRVPVPRPARVAAERSLYTDALQRILIVRPVAALARAADAFERRVLDPAVDATGRATVALAGAARWLEENAVDAAVDGLARATGRSGDRLRTVQSGRLYEYLRDAVIGAAALAAIVTIAALT